MSEITTNSENSAASESAENPVLQTSSPDFRNTDTDLAMTVSRSTIIVNLLLSGMKLASGIIAHSTAMVSDGVHSASDVLSTFIVIIGLHFSSKKSDASHQYGHERLECVAGILLSVLLAATGLTIGFSSGVRLIRHFQGCLVIETPGAVTLAAAAISIITKEIMYRYTAKAAQKLKSSAMMADAWHHRSDALSSIGSFIGILGARAGYPVLDPIAGIVICGFILKAAGEIFMDAVRKMTDEACDETTQDHMQDVILAQEGVLGIDSLKTRIFGSRIYVDAEIGVNGDMTLRDAHKIAEKVHHAIETEFSDVKHCMVHVNPYSQISLWAPEKDS